MDVAATAAAIADAPLSKAAAPDSFNFLPVLLGKPGAHPRDNLVVMSGTGEMAIVQGSWKYIPDLAMADGWKSGKAVPGAKPAGPGLYHLTADPGETKNLHATKPEISRRMNGLLESARAAASTRPASATKP